MFNRITENHSAITDHDVELKLEGDELNNGDEFGYKKNKWVEIMQAAPHKITKKSKAEKVFDETPNKIRSEILTLFKSEVGLTEAGASTYY